MSYTGQEESIIVPGPGTRARYETGKSRPIILVDLRDRNRLVQRGDFAIGGTKNRPDDTGGVSPGSNDND